MESTTIRIWVTIKEKLDRLGKKTDSYNDIIERLIKNGKRN